MKIGIVGHEAKKFIPYTEQMARELIRQLLEPADSVLVSGHCHLGGIDIWAEEIAKALGAFDPALIFAPKNQHWSTGYKPRNQQIAETAAVVHNIVVARYPEGYADLRFEDEQTGLPYCYHCKTDQHVKSGGCWTAKYAKELGKPAYWHVLEV